MPRNHARCVFVPFLWLACVASGLELRAGDGTPWPQFRGPRGDGHAVDAAPPLNWSESERVAWKTPIHGRSWSSPVVLENQIWLTTATEDGRELFAICVDFESGKVLLDRKLFDVAEPQDIHKTNTHASPTPVLEPGRAYLNFGSYGTACLDTDSFDVLWTRRDLPCNHWRGAGSSPILHGDLLIMHFDGYDYQYVVALDKRTGRTVWKVDRDIDYQTDNGDFKKAFATPLVIQVDGQDQLISPAAKATIAYDPRTGRELWRIHYENHSATARPLYGNGLVYLNSGFSKAELFGVRPDGQGDVTASHIEWIVDQGIGSKPSAVLVGDLLFQVHDQGTASCIDAVRGEVVWKKRLGGNFSASPILAAGRLYFTNQEGETTVLAPTREYHVLAVNQLNDGCWASPAAVGDSLILRTETHLYRLRE